MSRGRFGRWRGFTLVELIVALAIVSLALAVVPVSMAKLHESAQYRSAVRDVLAHLKIARNEAARRGEPVTFTLDLAERRIEVPGLPAASLPQSLEYGLIVAQRDLEGQRGSIVFYPDGGSTGGSVVLRRPGGDGVRLRVDWLLGRVSQEVME